MKIAFTGNQFPFGDGKAYGGERILYYLIQDLHKLGHEIYLFSVNGTTVNPKYLKDFITVPSISSEVDVYYEAVSKYRQDKNIEFDIYQCNYFGDGWNPKVLDDYFGYVELTWCKWCHINWQIHQQAFNTISYSKVLQDDFLEHGVKTTKIHYGIPKDLYQFEPDHEDYFVWIGKIEGGKAPHLAIKLAKAAGVKIVLMGPPYNTGCFYNQIVPYIDNESVFWVRGVDDDQKFKIMSKAKGFISSNDDTWKEHFGIVNAEALAMGVPIIAFNRINQDCAIKVDEIIEEGKHGFFLNYTSSSNEQEILDKGVKLVYDIGEIDRLECRRQFENKFTSELMAKRYDWFYNYILENGRVESVEVPF